jgi:hypothetical protein
MEATEQAQRIQSRYSENLDGIRTDKSLSDEGKKQAIATEYEATQKQLKSLREEADRAATTRRHDLQRRAFGIVGNTDPQTAISYRDAQDRAAGIEPRDESAALSLMHRASLSGDTILAKAIAARATDNGWGEVLQAYAEMDPAAAQAIDELAAISNANSSRGRTAQFHAQLLFSASKPRELR